LSIGAVIFTLSFTVLTLTEWRCTILSMLSQSFIWQYALFHYMWTLATASEFTVTLNWSDSLRLIYLLNSTTQAAQFKNSLEADRRMVKLRNFKREAHATGLLPASPLLFVCVTVYYYMTVKFVQSNAGTTLFILFGMFAMETCNSTHRSFTAFICSRNHSLLWKCWKGPSFYARFFHICDIDILTMLMFLNLLSILILSFFLSECVLVCTRQNVCI
jgi:hypothetical protein